MVITLAVRTPLCKAVKGGLKDTPLDGMMYKLLEQVIEKSKIDPALVEDVCFGNVSLGHTGLMERGKSNATLLDHAILYERDETDFFLSHRSQMLRLHTTPALLSLLPVSPTPLPPPP